MPCRVMHTYERSLVEQYRGRPFAILGVNGDPNKETLRLAREKDGLTWDSVWDGPGGPNTLQWSIKGYPTVFLLDQNGVIRFKNLGPPSRKVLEEQINILLQEIRHS
jgi:hypothetical protein